MRSSKLNRLAAIASDSKRIELEGRTDDIGGKAYNDRLARRRAEFVRSWLLKQGVAAEMVVRAEGLSCYLDTSPTETARRNNRRVEVRLVIRQDAVSNSKCWLPKLICPRRPLAVLWMF